MHTSFNFTWVPVASIQYARPTGYHEDVEDTLMRSGELEDSPMGSMSTTTRTDDNSTGDSLEYNSTGDSLECECTEQHTLECESEQA